ncbi:MAG: monofunctional biosynthetic peptidoglycan transglycosylase, partial [Elusimicrobia bacterium]|nr:monofunctional biosynthetic peptidoglycan transglycosylase [Elusimicrobiota bacterium]
MRRLIGAGAFAAAAVVVAAYLLWLPNVKHLALENPKTTAYIQLHVRSQRAKGKRPIVMMQWTRLSQISPHLRHAVVIAEDDMFYRHKGVDWEAVRHAIRYDFQKRRLARGASTITQQVARNLFLSPSRNPLRKVKEMLIAYKLERALTKDRILEIYLNIAEWGVGIYGAQAASRVYFGKDASMLGVEESVALAAALPSPWRLNPPKQTGPKMARRKEVLVER